MTFLIAEASAADVPAVGFLVAASTGWTFSEAAAACERTGVLTFVARREDRDLGPHDQGSRDSTQGVALPTPGRGRRAWAPLVGALIADVTSERIEILQVAVALQWRRRGVGGLLLEAVLGRARQLAVPVWLEVAADNTAALTLYGRRGFAMVGRRPNYYGRGRDALLMTAP